MAGKANRTSNIQDKIQDINSTVETMQTNMSPLIDLDMLDHFTKPQSNGAVLQIFIVLSNAWLHLTLKLQHFLTYYETVSHRRLPEAIRRILIPLTFFQQFLLHFICQENVSTISQRQPRVN